MSVVTLHPSETETNWWWQNQAKRPKSNFRGREPALVLVT